MMWSQRPLRTTTPGTPLIAETGGLNAMIVDSTALPEQAVAEGGSPADILCAQAYLRYQRALKAYNALDFDDLILKPTVLFEQHPDVLDKWQNQLHYLLVDEYQDTNASQYLLVKQLIGLRGALTVVGDDDQSIYAWRGAKPENLAMLWCSNPS